MTTISSRYFNQHTSKVQKAAEQAPVIITRRGEPSHVLMSIADFRILPIDEDTAAICARLHVPDRSPENDAWIAAIAIQHRLTLVTCNVADFSESGAKLLNPFE